MKKNRTFAIIPLFLAFLLLAACRAEPPEAGEEGKEPMKPEPTVIHEILDIDVTASPTARADEPVQQPASGEAAESPAPEQDPAQAEGSTADMSETVLDTVYTPNPELVLPEEELQVQYAEPTAVPSYNSSRNEGELDPDF